MPHPTTREEYLKKTMEDRFTMKKVILITALATLTGTIMLNPLNARAQSTPAQNAPAQDPKQIDFIRTWREACSKKDAENVEKCCQLSKELTDRYPDAEKQYIDAKKMMGKCALVKAEQKFTNALEAFYESAPEANELDALFSAGDAYLEIDKDPQSSAHILTVAQLALAGQRAVMVAGVYKNLDRVKTYAERSIQAIGTPNLPEKYKTGNAEYNLFDVRDETLANMNQYLGYYLIETKGDQPEAQDQALAYINKSIQVRSKDGKELFGWKDMYNYLLRRAIYTKQYLELKRKYEPLTDEQKNSDTGKDLIKQIHQLIDTKIIPELARIIATTAPNPAFYNMKNEAIDDFNKYWKYRVDDPSKAPAFLKGFEADPTIEGPPVSVKG
jgi:hypothetical protein